MKEEGKKQLFHGKIIIMDKRIEIFLGDITTLEVDAIVNAANSSLLGGGGVDGAIHAAAGSKLLQECKQLNGCKVGQAKITQGYDLPAKYVIHTVGPIYDKEKQGQEKELADCYINSLKIANEYELDSIAFPSISTGVYNYPIIEASKIAFQQVKVFTQTNTYPKKVIFCCFSIKDYQIYKDIVKNYKR